MSHTWNKTWQEHKHIGKKTEAVISFNLQHFQVNILGNCLFTINWLIAYVTSDIYPNTTDHIQSVAQSCPTLCDPITCSMPGLPVHHQLPEFTQTHVHWVSDAIQPSHPLLSPSPPAFNLFQHQGLFQWVNSSHEVAKVLEFQLQH